LLVQQRQRLLASVVGSSGTSVLNFIVNFILGNRWIQRSFSGKDGEQETKELEDWYWQSSKRAVPVRWCIVWSPKTMVIISGGKW